MKKSLLSTLALGLIVTAGTASAAPITQDIHVIATVPTADFYVIPQGGWPTSPVPLSYDIVTSAFSQYHLPLRVKNTLADVEASLAYPAVLAEHGGSANLALDVTVSGNALSTTAVKFHDQDANERVHLLSITSSQALPTPGNYQGTVALVFDAAP